MKCPICGASCGITAKGIEYAECNMFGSDWKDCWNWELKKIKRKSNDR